MSLYENNLSKLKVYNEFIYQQLVEYQDLGYFDLEYNLQIIESKDNLKTYLIDSPVGPIRLNSIYYQEKEAARWANQYKVTKSNQVVICFGLGNGVFANELLKVIKEDTILIVIEPSMEIFQATLNLFDLSKLFDYQYFQVFIGKDNEDAFTQVMDMTINWTNVDTAVFCYHTHYDQLFSKEYKRFYKLFIDSKNNIIVNHMTNMAITKTNHNNLFENLKLLNRSRLLTEVKDLYDNSRPAIIVSAGPSLDKNIHQLKHAKGFAYIIAVDTAVKYLLAQNIMPDIIVTLDPSKSPHHLLDPICFDIPLFCRIESNHIITSNFNNLVFFNLEGYAKSLFERANRIVDLCNSGGSVTTGAFSICVSLGFKEVIFVGSDLAYLDNKTHAGNLNIDVGDTARYLETVEDIYGNFVQTRYDWYIYLKWLEDAIKSFPHIKVIDATEGGAKIHGSEIKTLKEVIDKIHEEFNDTYNMHSIRQIVNYESIIELLKDDLSVLLDMKAKLQDNINCTKKIIKNEKFRQGKSNSLLKTISKNNKWIETQDIYILIDWDVVRETTEDMVSIINSEESSVLADNDAIKKSLNIYDSMNHSIDRFIPQIKEVIASVKDRI
jgi:hypothetical protein